MSTLNRERWEEISPFLDKLLSLPEQERGPWLESFRKQRPDLAGLLQDLWNEQSALAHEHFLEHIPLEAFAEPLRPGRTVGAYTLISPIGQGGMGSVWLAERSDGRFERRVAVKFLNFSLAVQGAERFKREGSILGRLSDPRIAELLDAGITSNGEPYLVLEHVEGEHIDEYCDRRALGIDARIRLFLDVLGAVAHAHANLIVHRDIKPSNVLVRNDGRVKLLDFGIAKLLAEDASPAPPTALTAEAGGAMTLQFASPEQLTGGAITTATDVYALGVLLYVLLTGRHPSGPGPHTTAELVRAIVDIEPPRMSVAFDSSDVQSITERRNVTPDRLRRQLRGDLDTIVAKSLKKNPAERYVSVTGLSDDLNRYLKHEPISVRPDTTAYRVAKFIRRKRTAVALASLALIAAIAGISGTLVQAHVARRQRDTAIRERDRANRVSDFMTDMFSMPDPSKSRGNSITAREVLDRASKQIDTSLAKDPELQAEMMCVMGKTYSRLGVDSKAQPLLERAIEIGRLGNYSSNAVILSCSSELAMILIQSGQFSDAEKLLQNTLATERSTIGPENPVTLETMSNEAYALLEEHRSDEAISLASEAYQTQLHVQGEDALGTLWSMNVYGVILCRTGRLAESETLYRNQLEIVRRVYGNDSWDALNAVSNLGAILVLMGRLPEAQDMLQQTLETQRRVYGVQHPEVGRTEYNLACLAARQNHSDEAFSYLQDAVKAVYIRTLMAMVKDSDLSSLHSDPRWPTIMAVAKQRVAASQKPNGP
jgi:serine/threonine protein kinase/Tfp pilus assembly protein PilF